MKKFVLLLCFILPAGLSLAQNLTVGRKAPELKIAAWAGETPRLAGIPCLIEFALTAGNRAAALDRLASQYAGRMNVVVVFRDKAPEDAESHLFFAGVDDAGKSFAACRVQYVPFTVLVDSSWKVVWFGNPSSLAMEEIDNLLKQ